MRWKEIPLLECEYRKRCEIYKLKLVSYRLIGSRYGLSIGAKIGEFEWSWTVYMDVPLRYDVAWVRFLSGWSQVQNSLRQICSSEDPVFDNMSLMAVLEEIIPRTGSEKWPTPVFYSTCATLRGHISNCWALVSHFLCQMRHNLFFSFHICFCGADHASVDGSWVSVWNGLLFRMCYVAYGSKYNGLFGINNVRDAYCSQAFEIICC